MPAVQRAGEPQVVYGARQHECADHLGNGDERIVVRARLPPR
jgi:hypothetical protein